MPISIEHAAGVLLGVIAFTGLAHAGVVNEDHGLAIKGYDPVAYFTDHKAVKGSEAHKYEYHSAVYEFASAAHRRLFAAAPEKYLPQFDGFCAYGVAVGHKADIDPEAFSIISGKLYLNYNLDVRDTWKKDIPGYLQKAQTAWPAVAQQTEVVH